MSTAKKSNPTLWKRIVASVKAGSKGGNPGQWSARKAQLATLKYKQAGGGYSGKKSASNSLSSLPSICLWARSVFVVALLCRTLFSFSE